LTAYRKITRIIEIESPDIAHIHLYRGVFTASILLALKKSKIPIVLTLHEYSLLCPHSTFRDGKGEICERCLKGSTINCVINKCNKNNLLFSITSFLEFEFHKIFFPFDKYFDKYIAVSKFIKKKHMNTKIDEQKFVHLYNFIPKLSEIVPVNRKGSYFIYFGRLSEEKGINTLIESWLIKERKSKLFIIGEGYEEESIKNKIKHINNVKLLGFKDGKELQDLIKFSSFVIVPSEWLEVLGMVILEAYSYGKPVIASETGGIKEIVLNDETGYLFKMKSKEQLSELIDKAEMMTDEKYYLLSHKARKFVEENFNEEKHYNVLIRVYNSLINITSL